MNVPNCSLPGWTPLWLGGWLAAAGAVHCRRDRERREEGKREEGKREEGRREEGKRAETLGPDDSVRAVASGLWRKQRQHVANGE